MPVLTYLRLRLETLAVKDCLKLRKEAMLAAFLELADNKTTSHRIQTCKERFDEFCGLSKTNRLLTELYIIASKQGNGSAESTIYDEYDA